MVTSGGGLRAIAVLLSALAVTPMSAEGAALGEPSGSGPFKATAETRVELPGHTLYRPDAPSAGALPLFVWGNGACRDNGLQHAAFLREIASRGYWVVAVGRPVTEARPTAGAAPPAAPAGPPRDETRPEQLLEAIDWAVRENASASSDLRGRIDITRIAVGGHSCGGLQALAVSADPRIRTTLVLNSGIYVDGTGRRSGVAIDKSALGRLHAPVLYLTGGATDVAHRNSLDDFERIDTVPVFLGSLPVGHEGTFWTEANGGTWARVAARWLDWQLKSDADASWDFAGPECRLCRDPRWTTAAKRLGLPQGPFRESLYVPVRDGTRLAMNVYRAARDGRPITDARPVVFSFTPYRARFRDERTGRTVEHGQFPQGGHLSLLENGYVLAVADIRGKGASFGARRGFSDRTEAQDGHDLVQWLARQPWSNGRVGMYGCSYLGGTTVHVASTRPPALRAIFTGATDFDKFAFVRNGGITAQFNTRADEPLAIDLMSLPVDEDTDGRMLRTAVAEHARNTPMAPLWYGMPFRDSRSEFTGTRFWEESSPYTYLAALKSSGIATYYWSNWRDEPTGQVILAARNLGSRLLLGPGTHCVPPPDFDLAGEVRSYFDAHLKPGGVAAPTRRVTWWLEGATDAWQRSDALPGEGVPRERWYLAAAASPGEGRLQTTAATRGTAGFTVDYGLPPTDAFPFWIDSQHGRGASFETAPLASARDLLGFPLVSLTVSADAAEPLLFAYLELVPPQGSAEVLSFGRLAVAYRKESQAPYDTLGLPWHGGRRQDQLPLKDGRAVSLRLALTPTARRLPAGARLRLVITGADPRQRNLQSIRIDPAPNVRILTGRGSESRIDLSLRPVAP